MWSLWIHWYYSAGMWDSMSIVHFEIHSCSLVSAPPFCRNSRSRLTLWLKVFCACIHFTNCLGNGPRRISFPILSLSLRNEQCVIVLPQFLEKPVPQEAFAGKWAGQVKQSMKRLTKVLPVGRDGGDMVVARTLCSRLSTNLLSCGDSATRGRKHRPSHEQQPHSDKSNVNRLNTLTVFGIRQRPSD